MITKYLGESVSRTFFTSLAEKEFTYLSVDLEDIQKALVVMNRYADIPIGFVDASLVALAERHKIVKILTLGDFHKQSYQWLMILG
jgi:uncharacterized protein